MQKRRQKKEFSSRLLQSDQSDQKVGVAARRLRRVVFIGFDYFIRQGFSS